MSEMSDFKNYQWRKKAENGDGEFAFFICQIRHFAIHRGLPVSTVISQCALKVATNVVRGDNGQYLGAGKHPSPLNK